MYENQPIETKQAGAYSIQVHYDLTPESPREWDNLGVLVLFHGRYDLANEDGMSLEDAKDLEQNPPADTVVLPVYMYDHSGVSLRAGEPYSCPWDSGQVGIIYTTRELCDKYGVEFSKAADIMKSEVDTYGKYIEGNVYGFTVTDSDGDVLDSCWGFYSVEDAMKEGESQAEWYTEQDRKKHQAKTKAYIQNGVPLNKRIAA